MKIKKTITKTPIEREKQLMKEAIDRFGDAKTVAGEADADMKEAKAIILGISDRLPPDRTTDKSKMYASDNYEVTITVQEASPSPDIDQARKVLTPAKFKMITRTVEVIDEHKLITAHEDGKITDKEFAAILIKKRADSVAFKVKEL